MDKNEQRGAGEPAETSDEADVVVAVEYDCRGARVRKGFECMYEARRFYAAKDKAGKRPKVRRPG